MNWHEEIIKEHPLFGSVGRVNDPDLLYPPFREKIHRLILTAIESGLNVGLFESYRSNRRQLSLYLKRKSKLRKNGMHFFGVAADIVFMNTRGGWTWTPERCSKEPWKRLGQIGKDLGLVWGGDWKDFVDSGHFQYIPVAEQDTIRRGEYPSWPKDPLAHVYDNKERAAAMNARREIVQHLSPIYKAAMKDARISQETMAKLNAFRYSTELENVNLKG